MRPPDKLNWILKRIRRNIASGKWPQYSRLPSTRDLSKSFEVTQNTVLKAIRQLKAENLVFARSKSGVFVGSRQGTPLDENEPLSGPRKSRPEAIAESIIKDILSGDFAVGDYLPLQKSLAFEYKASPITLSKAIHLVKKRNLVHQKGSGFVVGPSASSAPSRKGTVLVYGERQWFVQPGINIWATLLKSLERHLRQSGLRLDSRLSMEFSIHGRFPVKDVPSQARAVVILGRDLLNIAGHECRAFRGDINRLLRNGIPVVLFGLGPFPKHVAFNERGLGEDLSVFRPDDVIAGAEVAKFTGSLGHKDMAFFGLSNDKWNRDRMDGLAHQARIMMGPAATLGGFNANYYKRDIWKTKKMRSPEVAKILGPSFERLFGDFKFSHHGYYGGIASYAHSLATVDRHWQYLEPLFESALSQKKATVWVCADATVGCVAFDYLQREGIRVPRDISLIAMDDNIEAQYRQITAHSFQVERIGYLMAHAILRDIPMKRERNREVICPQTVIDRGSVGRV